MVTVAVCEDDAALRSVLSRSLSGAGHEVLLAHNGAEALRVFPSAAPDVVILDIGLAATSAWRCAPAAWTHRCCS